MEKNQKQCRNFQNFWKDTCSGRSGKNTGFRKEKSKKVRKIRRFPNFSGRYLVKAKVYQRWQRQFFAKKFKKIPPMGRFLERYLFGDDPGKIQASGKKNRKKSEKIRRFPNFSGRYLVKAKGAAGKRRKEKTEKSLKKLDHFRIFVEDTCLERSDGNFNNNAQ